MDMQTNPTRPSGLQLLTEHLDMVNFSLEQGADPNMPVSIEAPWP